MKRIIILSLLVFFLGIAAGFLVGWFKSQATSEHSQICQARAWRDYERAWAQYCKLSGLPPDCQLPDNVTSTFSWNTLVDHMENCGR
jgi:hypothetical protein